MATNTARKTLGVASVVVGCAAATFVLKSTVVGATARSCRTPESTARRTARPVAKNRTRPVAKNRRCKAGETDCKG
ncbi:hypothetical protein [Streptomyces sp. CB01881]|uniref:hypothetical protein n=1 Tax=Streptomyces sp. CB01881 TaxID=2078691 RepID=UPI000CDCBF86|nr:hypothetical protein [Streptomyces sp. CB01881]AUY49042.1 hypothetical protein C2142_08915 [Streptomyces sp. CB01881]TYC77533.1 hypothetical protein EH183_08920 [Streptomyces sp. CB01881]